MYYLKFSISICITVVCSVNGGNSVEHTEKKTHLLHIMQVLIFENSSSWRHGKR